MACRLLSSSLIFFGLLCALLLSACTPGREYQSPELGLQQEWTTLKNGKKWPIHTACQAKVSEGCKGWWQRFNDKTLTQLMEKAIVGNNDLKISEARIIEARANERLSTSALLPQIDSTASATREKSRDSLGDRLDSLSRTGVNGAWDVDLFGANRRRMEAAGAGIEAAEADHKQTRLALLAEVARNYVRLRAAQAQYAIIKKNLNIQINTLRITKGQREEGAITDLDVVRAQAQVEVTEARLPQVRASIDILMNRLSILTGEQPGVLAPLLKKRKPIPTIPQKLAIAVPIKAIAGRADVQAAERRLAQASALSNAAIADFYPKLSLQGFFGVQHSNLYGSVSPWSVTANALLPLLNFSKLSAQFDAADARKLQAFMNYKQTVLLALEDIESTLSTYLNELHRRTSLKLIARLQVKAAEIAREQYKSGITGQIDLLVAERNRLDAENEVILSEQTVAENLILLYRALGERW